VNTHERFKEYSGEKCWQAHISDLNREADLELSGLTAQKISRLKVSDFEFEYVPKEDKPTCAEIKQFIERHEWLGKMPIWATHRFTARLKKNGILAGVIVMATPNTFSNLLGRENKDKEKLIARGASISWSPKNMGSWLIMNAVRWMVDNTEFRYFTAYSDPEAKELGTIYQACNFIYLGQKFGTGKQFLDPDNPKRGWFGAAGFSDRSQIVRYAKKLGITWQPEWYKMVGSKKNYRKVDWKAIPEAEADMLKQARKDHRARCQQRPSPSKHKYVYILGRSKRETKALFKKFAESSPKKVGLEYPRARGI
tara:strand:+ start:1351 stop:2280 length:930 start_codon:yes stop_codon:yes gene_type:complete